MQDKIAITSARQKQLRFCSVSQNNEDCESCGHLSKENTTQFVVCRDISSQFRAKRAHLTTPPHSAMTDAVTSRKKPRSSDTVAAYTAFWYVFANTVLRFCTQVAAANSAPERHSPIYTKEMSAQILLHLVHVHRKSQDLVLLASREET